MRRYIPEKTIPDNFIERHIPSVYTYPRALLPQRCLSFSYPIERLVSGRLSSMWIPRWRRRHREHERERKRERKVKTCIVIGKVSTVCSVTFTDLFLSKKNISQCNNCVFWSNILMHLVRFVFYTRKLQYSCPPFPFYPELD